MGDGTTYFAGTVNCMHKMLMKWTIDVNVVKNVTNTSAE